MCFTGYTLLALRFGTARSPLLTGPFQMMQVKTGSGLPAAFADGGRGQECLEKSAEDPKRSDNGAYE